MQKNHGINLTFSFSCLSLNLKVKRFARLRTCVPFWEKPSSLDPILDMQLIDLFNSDTEDEDFN